MESRLGHDFSQVRVHSNPDAAASAASMNALAYTVGSDVVFGSSQYEPTTHAGLRLLAHELAHVAQNSRAPITTSPLAPVEPKHPSEVEATNAAAEVMNGTSRLPILGRAPLPVAGISRQETTPQQSAAPAHDWVMLAVPPVVGQQSLTCWAAALSSWLEATGADKISFQDIILRYAGTSCIDPDNALPYANAPEVYGEWGARFTLFADSTALSGATVRQLLRTRGHLLFAQTGRALGHVLVVYGSGFDDKRQPNPNFISVMDPLSPGTLRNLPLASLSFPVEVGHLAARVRPAPCRSKPGKVPD